VSRCLFTVEDSFSIEGHGLTLVPGIVPQGEERFRVGDPVLLKRPDGSEMRWQIGGLEMICCGSPRHDVATLLFGLTKADIPIGTEVWSVAGA
jgi:hypothetical protein